MNLGNLSRMTANTSFNVALLEEIKRAVRHVRRHTPDSHLADLAESKVTAMEAEKGLSIASD